MSNFISIVNSTTSNIDAGDNFTGKIEDVSQYNTIVSHVIADQDLTIEIYQSNDGTNWDIYDSYSASGPVKVFTDTVKAKYFYKCFR